MCTRIQTIDLSAGSVVCTCTGAHRTAHTRHLQTTRDARRSDAALTSLPLGRSGARSKSLEGPCGFKRVIRFHCIVLMHIVVLKNVPTPALSRQTLNVFTPTLSSNPPCSRNNLHMSEMIIRNHQIFCRALLSEHGCAHTLLDACTTDGDGRKYSSA